MDWRIIAFFTNDTGHLRYPRPAPERGSAHGSRGSFGRSLPRKVEMRNDSAWYAAFR